MNRTDRLSLLFLAAVAVTVSTFAWAAWNPTFIQNDGVQYLSTAKNWLNGLGFSTDALIFDPHYQDMLPAPETVWPPGYPFAVSLSSLTGLDMQRAGFAFNLVAQATSFLFAFLMLRKCGLKAGVAVVAATCLYLSLTPWNYVFGITSEPLFCALMLMALYCLPASLERKAASWIVCGFLVTASIYTRYTGVFFAAAIGLGSMAWFIAQGNPMFGREARLPGRLISLMSLPMLGFLVLLIRNRNLTGDFIRTTGSDEAEAVVPMMARFWRSGRDLSGYIDGGILSDHSNRVLFVVLVVSAVGSAALAIRHNYRTHRGRFFGTNRYFSLLATVVMAHTFVCLAYFAHNGLTSSLPNVLPRYLYQIYPGLLIVFSVLVGTSALSHAIGRGVARSWLRVSAAVATTAFLVGQVSAFPTAYRHSRNGEMVMSALDQQLDMGLSIRELIDECFAGAAPGKPSPPGSVWSNEGQLIHIHTGVATLTLPDRWFIPFDYDWALLREQISDYDVRLFVLIQDPDTYREKFVVSVSSIEHMLRSNGASERTLVNEGTGISVFVTEQAPCPEQPFAAN